MSGLEGFLLGVVVTLGGLIILSLALTRGKKR